MTTEVMLPLRRPSAYSDPAPNAADAGTKPNRKNNKKKVEDEWAHYMGDETLEENWTRFLHDLGLGDFKSKTQCKKVGCLFHTPHTHARRSQLVGLPDTHACATNSQSLSRPPPPFLSLSLTPLSFSRTN